MILGGLRGIGAKVACRIFEEHLAFKRSLFTSFLTSKTTFVRAAFNSLLFYLTVNQFVRALLGTY